MNTELFITPLKALNKAYRRQKVNREEIESFRSNLSQLIKNLNEEESEEHLKNNVMAFLSDTWYKKDHFINTKGRTDFVIHQEKSPKSKVGVLTEVKRPGNRSEMISKDQLNAKALQELLLYYLREHKSNKDTDIKYLIVTNVYEWFIFDAVQFHKYFYNNRKLQQAFQEWESKQLEGTDNPFFYSKIASKYISEVEDKLEYTWFDLREHDKELQKKEDSKKLIALYKVLSPIHLLKKPFANDSNSLNKQFYHELLHIIGLEEVKEKGKKVILRKGEGKRIEGSFLENAIITMDEKDLMQILKRPSHFGNTQEERLYAVALELCITWINRVLFLKLMESQLVSYHKGDQYYRFLNVKTVPNYDALDSLFFGVLAKKLDERSDRYKEKYSKVPYLNSSLFEPTGLEQVLYVTGLNNNFEHELYSRTVLKDATGRPLSGKMDALEYLFRFLDAYDFSSEGKEEIQEESKSLINASVLGLIFEKINGYKDGSFYTPGFITMYMCRETIRQAIVQKFNETKGWKLESFDQLYDKVDDKKEANQIINSLKICDPAVGSGHFLVSALNEIISIKSELKILVDREGKTLRDYEVTIENDELIVESEGELFQYTLGNKEKQRVQETLFHEKQTIIENCLFGVDINPNSVKICRLRLWIELLKNAYYKNETELETLPNIDINIKTGNSLISRFDLDTDISDALKKSKWDVSTYRNVVNGYKNATRKEDKREFERLIEDIKGDFETEISKKDKRVMRTIKLKGELFNLTEAPKLFEQTVAEKKKWGKDVETKTKALQKLEHELANIKNNQIYEDAFEWRFEFPEVLDDDGNFVGFDALIGNPPYIRAEEIGKEKEVYKSFELFINAADIYYYFYELGYKVLKPSGTFCFINNTFDKTTAGKALRSFVNNNFVVNKYIDFTSVIVFEEATTYPIVLVAEKSSETGTSFDFMKVEESNYGDKESLFESSKFMPVRQDTLGEEAWNFLNPEEAKIINKIGNNKLLEEQFGKCYRGIITGLNEAFIVNKDFCESGHFHLVYDGKDIKKWASPPPFKKMIVFQSKSTKAKYGALSEHEAHVKMVKDFPEVFKHLDNFKVRAIKRYDKGEYWWELRNCAYYDLFNKSKIIFPNLQNSNKFAWDDSGVYLNAPSVFLPTDQKWLLGILNSKLIWYFLKSICVVRSGGYIEVKPQYFEQVPIVEPTDIQKSKIENYVSQILEVKMKNPQTDVSKVEAEIDQLVNDIYGLTDEEIKIVEKS